MQSLRNFFESGANAAASHIETKDTFNARKGTQVVWSILSVGCVAGGVFSLAKAISALVAGSAFGLTFWAFSAFACYEFCRFNISVVKYASNSSNFVGINAQPNSNEELAKLVHNIVKTCSRETLVLRHVVDFVEEVISRNQR